jgi:hypothetical protein
MRGIRSKISTYFRRHAIYAALRGKLPLEQGEREQLARIEREREELAQTKIIIESEADDKRTGRTIESRGQIFGFIAFLIIASIGGGAMYLGQNAIAITCFTTFVLGVVGMFLTGRKKQSTSDNE